MYWLGADSGVDGGSVFDTNTTYCESCNDYWMGSSAGRRHYSSTRKDLMNDPTNILGWMMSCWNDEASTVPSKDCVERARIHPSVHSRPSGYGRQIEVSRCRGIMYTAHASHGPPQVMREEYFYSYRMAHQRRQDWGRLFNNEQKAPLEFVVLDVAAHMRDRAWSSFWETTEPKSRGSSFGIGVTIQSLNSSQANPNKQSLHWAMKEFSSHP